MSRDTDDILGKNTLARMANTTLICPCIVEFYSAVNISPNNDYSEMSLKSTIFLKLINKTREIFVN